MLSRGCLVVQFSGVLTEEARSAPGPVPLPEIDSGLVSLAMVAAHYRISCDPAQMAHDLALGHRPAKADELVRAAKRIGLKAKVLRAQTKKRLLSVPLPAILHMSDGTFAMLTHRLQEGKVRLLHPASRMQSLPTLDEAVTAWSGEVVLITRRLGGSGVDPATFNLN
jgi:ATP-binding cassette, subfamily B, bacterial HlyB/CyaB